MRWLPRIELMGVGTIVGECKPQSCEAHGVVLQFSWLGLVLEFVMALERGR